MTLDEFAKQAIEGKVALPYGTTILFARALLRAKEALEYELKVSEAWTKQAFGAPGHDIAFLEMMDCARAALRDINEMGKE